MAFDINQKIEELKGNLEKVRRESTNPHMPKWYAFIWEELFKMKIEKLEAIRNKSFKMSLELEIHCDHFGTRKFPIADFNLTDENTLKCAMMEDFAGK